MIAIVPIIFLRVILPIILLSSWIVRPSLISAFYGILVLLWPFVPGVNGGLKTWTKRYVIICVAVSSLALLAQVIFQIVLVSLPPYGRIVPDCEELAGILRLIGLQRLNIPDVGHIIRLILPDVAACLASIATFIVCLLYNRSIAATRANLEQLPTTQPAQSSVDASTQRTRVESVVGPGEGVSSAKSDRVRTSSILLILAIRFSDILALLLLCAVGVIYPSVLSAIYFLAFLFILTWWAAYRPFSVACLTRVKFCLLTYAAIHMLLLYMYQTPQFQTALDPASLPARLIGFSALINLTCSEFWTVHFVSDQQWPAFVNPFVLFAFYIYVAFQTVCIQRVCLKVMYHRRREVAVSADDMSSIHEELLPSDSENVEAVHADQNRELDTGPTTAPRPPAHDYRRFYSFGSVPMDHGGHTILGAFLGFITRHSYALALVMMMAWAITYHSWLSFVWLVLACLIWMLKDSRKSCLALSPFIVFYAEALLLLQFIYGLRLTDQELPDSTEITGVPLKQIGLVRPTQAACIPLFVKIFYSLSFWVILRLWLHERRCIRETGQPTMYGTFESVASSTGLGSGWLSSLLTKYWIYVVGLVLLLISIRTPVVAYEVCYMAFFVVLITVLQASFGLWRVMLFLYWMILTAFSIAVLLAVYTYQFTEVPIWWYNLTHWPSETFEDLGLVTFAPADLFVRLLTPLSFLTVVILQLKFFHAGFMRLTNFSRHVTQQSDAAEPVSGPETDPNKRWTKKIIACYTTLCNLLWRIGELHFGKLVALALLLLSVNEISAVNFVFVVLICFMLPCRRLSTLFCVLATIWAALVVLTKMIYQMRFVVIDVKSIEFLTENCSDISNDTSDMDPARWAGFEKLPKDRSVSNYLSGYIWMFIILTFQAIIKIHQKYNREVLGRPTPARGVIFPDIGRKEADENIIKCLMYLANYGFYKFGLEITFIVVVIDIGIRMDGVAFLYAWWLLLMIALPRRSIARVWWLFVIYVAVALAIQYAACVGLPPSACLQYPWTGIFDSGLSYWLYLPSYSHLIRPNPYYLIGDFFILLMASAQCYVFKIELSSQAASFEGGDNGPIFHSSRNVLGESGQPLSNPTPNFIVHTNSYLDFAKIFVFLYFHWITLFVVFAAGVGGISGFAFGYLVAAFTLLWKGNDLYLEPHRRVMLRWYILLFYNVFVILLKVAMEVVGCVYKCGLCGSASSWLVQLFSIACLRGPQPVCNDRADFLDNKVCIVHPEESEIVYDAIAFGFLVFQIRIFSSWYFRHSIAEFRAERILSSRGAALMNLLIRKEMNKQKTAEDQTLQNVKTTTDRIRQKYVEQMTGKKYFEPASYADGGCPMLRSFKESFYSAMSHPDSYADAKRAGDYYMFDESDDKETEKRDIFETEPLAPELTPGADVEKVGPGQLIHLAGVHDLNIDDIVADAKRLDAEMHAQSSKPPIHSSGALEEEVKLEKSTDDLERSSEEKESGPVKGALESACRFMKMLLVSSLNYLTFTFNRWSRDYRYVAFVLKGEKQRLKERLTNELENEDDFGRVRETIFNNAMTREVRQVQTEADVEAAQEEAQKSASEHSVFMRFLIATFYLIVSHTELLCYLMIVLDHMGNAAVISLPLPFLAFFWGTLCSPRPPKFFWVTVITYTEAMIVVKFMFQFGFWRWDITNSSDPFYTPKILGIERKAYYAAYDVTLLMVLFFHRYVLKGLGLWKDARYATETLPVEPDPLETPDAVETTLVHQGKADVFELQEVTSHENDAAIPLTNDAAATGEGTVRNDRKSGPGQGRMAYCSSFVAFYRHLLHPVFRYIMDLYSFMFLCDLICFLILAFGYSRFGVSKGREDVVTDISSNKVPLPFVLMLITLMVLIIIDRAIYLRKSALGKLVFQYLLVTALHLWIFFGLPAVTDDSVLNNVPAQLFYFVKCVYFLLSAWQIRNGYPSRVQGNLLTKRFGMTNYCLFTGFMAIPFLFELRTLIDWVWTDTSMPLFDYFTMENMYACVFRAKCMRKFEKEYPVPRGIAKGLVVKYGMGLPMLILIVVLLWLPLLLFALINSVGARLPPDRATFTVTIEGYPPLYAMEAQRNYLSQISNGDYNKLNDLCNRSKQAMDFLNEYGEQDIFRVNFRPAANKYWTITKPSREALLKDLTNTTSDIYIHFEWDFKRPPKDSKSQGQTQSGRKPVKLKQGDPARNALYLMLESSEPYPPANISNAYPPFVVIPSVGSALPAKEILFVDPTVTKGDSVENAYAGTQLRLQWEQDNITQYWEANMIVPNWLQTFFTPSEGGLGIGMVLFVDRVFPSALDSVTSGGIIGLYIVVVLAAGRFIRTLVVNSPTDVILNEMPNVDRIVELCQNVFLVREARDFLLEQDLFAKLVFLFRSPETLIRWTRPKLE